MLVGAVVRVGDTVGIRVAVLVGPVVPVGDTVGVMVAAARVAVLVGVGCKTMIVVPPVLSTGSGSSSLASTPLRSTTTPLWVAVRLIESVTGALIASVPTVHVTVSPVRIQPLDARLKLTPNGNVVVTTTPVAKLGPVFVKVKV